MMKYAQRVLHRTSVRRIIYQCKCDLQWPLGIYICRHHQVDTRVARSLIMCNMDVEKKKGKRVHK